MSKHTSWSRRSQAHYDHLSIAPADLQRLRARLHGSEHVVLNPQEAHTVLQLVDLLTPANPATPSARRSKPAYQRQQHRHVRRSKT